MDIIVDLEQQNKACKPHVGATRVGEPTESTFLDFSNAAHASTYVAGDLLLGMSKTSHQKLALVVTVTDVKQGST